MRFPTCHGITHTGPCRVAGRHLSLAPNEPLFSEAELIASDRNRNVDKAAALLARDVEAAHADEVHMLRCLGAI